MPRHLCRNETLAEDITQEAFLRVLEKVMRGQVAGNLRAYCFVTARHLYLDRPAASIAAGTGRNGGCRR